MSIDRRGRVRKRGEGGEGERGEVREREEQGGLGA